MKFCPLYLAAFLRLEYLDQASGPYLIIASVKPEINDNFSNGFYLRNFENILWLRGYRSDGFDGWPGRNELKISDLEFQTQKSPRRLTRG